MKLPQLIGPASELLPGTAISADPEKERVQKYDRCVYISSVYSLGVLGGDAFDEIDSFELFNGIYTRELHPVDPGRVLYGARLWL